MRVFVNPHPGTVLPMIFGERGRERDIDGSLSCLLRGPTGWPGDGPALARAPTCEPWSARAAPCPEPNRLGRRRRRASSGITLEFPLAFLG